MLKISACAFCFLGNNIKAESQCVLRGIKMRVFDIKFMFDSKSKEVIIDALCKTYQYASKRDKEDLDEVLNALAKDVKE